MMDMYWQSVKPVSYTHLDVYKRQTLYQGLPKGDKMEMIVQKAVELGVAEIVPVAMKRCVVKLDAKKAAKKVSRWNTIALSLSLIHIYRFKMRKLKLILLKTEL